MVDCNLNSTGIYIVESVVHYIGLNVHHIGYACVCTNHVRKERKKFKYPLRGNYVIITWIYL